MTPNIGTYNTSLQNTFYFSPCSIKSFKELLLANKTVSTNAQCLSNVPFDLPAENTYFNAFLPGQLWSLDQQCKIVTGDNRSTACRNSPWEKCLDFYCLYFDILLLTQNPFSISNVCSTEPCLNGATCVSTFNLYVCQCPAGFSGQNCENKI
jgi:hypothetical protein